MTKKEKIKLLECSLITVADKVIELLEELEETRESCINAIETIERQLEIQDNELDRRLTIIHYLEDRLRNND